MNEGGWTEQIAEHRAPCLRGVAARLGRGAGRGDRFRFLRRRADVRRAGGLEPRLALVARLCADRAALPPPRLAEGAVISRQAIAKRLGVPRRRRASCGAARALPATSGAGRFEATTPRRGAPGA